jgi:two-component system phosphate regulon sensor histidine kinase PhoR
LAGEKTGHVLEGTFLSNINNFKRTLLSVSDGIYLTDKDRRIILWNPASETITGYSASDVLGSKCSDNILCHIDKNGRSLCESDLCPLYRSIQTGIPSDKPLLVYALRKDKSRLAVEVSVAPLFSEDGEVIGGIEVFRDVTLKQQMAEKRAQFLSSISHELKGPITVIQGFLELILAGSTGEINQLQSDFLYSAFKEGERFKKILDDLSDLARFESAEFSFVFEKVDITELLCMVINRNTGEAVRKGIMLEDIIQEGLEVYGDWHRLYQVFSNLLSNAFKYTEQGKVVVSARQAEDNIIVEVTDTGIGIAEKDKASIFNIFYRVDNPISKRVGGTGIGLSIVKTIVERHNGLIEVKSTPGEGSSFIVTIPSYKEC